MLKPGKWRVYKSDPPYDPKSAHRQPPSATKKNPEFNGRDMDKQRDRSTEWQDDATRIPIPGRQALSVPPRVGGAGFMLRALRYRNYRLFFGGQIISLAGTWITTTATSWLVYRLSGSAFLLGFVGFAGQCPAFFLGPFAGILVDRWDRRRLLIATQIISMLQSFALAALTFGGSITVEAIVGLSLIQGIVNAFDMPGRQAFLITMVENKEDLPNAIALNSSMVNVARLVGPSIAGIMIVATNEGWCFLIDGFSYAGVILALVAMRVAPRKEDGHRPGVRQQFIEGWRYISQSQPIRSIMTLLALVSLVGVPYSVLMPIFASVVFHGGPHTLGLLMTSAGSGALAGALWLASRRTVRGLGRVIVVACSLFGAGLIGFSFAPVLPLAIPCLVIAGFGFIVQLASSNTIIQTIVDDDKRGRVMSFYMMAQLGTAPFGSLLAGWVSSRIGAPHTVLFGGICCLAGAAWFNLQLPAIRAAVRPIYTRMGIVPQVAAGLADAAELSVPPEQR